MMKKHGLRRFFSLLLAVMMVCALLPTAALAEDTAASKAEVAEEGKQGEVKQPEGGTPEEPKPDGGKQPEGGTPEEPKQDEVKQPEDKEPVEVETPANENTPAAPTRVSKSPAVAAAKKSIPITVKVHDGRTGNTYTVGSGEGKQGSGGGVGFLYYKLPDLNFFVAANTFGSISKVKKGSNIADPELINWEVGKDVVWSVLADSGYITYYVDQYTPATDTDDTHWLKSFKLTYDGNGEGATNVPAEQVYRTNKSNETTHNFTIPTTIPTRSGYNFNGWSDTADGTVTYQQGSSIAVTGSTTLYAVWEKNTYTVTYTDGVENEEVFADQVNQANYEDDTPAFSGGTPTRKGYVFGGWDPAVATKVTEGKIYSATWKPDVNGNGIADDQEEKFTVTYTDGVDGVDVFEDVVYKNLLCGTKTPYKKDPTRRGYVFTGWNPAVAETVTESVTYAAQWENKAERAIKDLLKHITVKCVSGVESHTTKTYDTDVGGYTAITTENTDGTFTSKITVVAQMYVEQYNKDTSETHVLVNKEDTTKTVTVKLGKDYRPVDVATDKPLITFEVKCKDEVVPPEKPTLAQLPEISVTLHCGTASAHRDPTWSPLLENTYEISAPTLKNDVYTCTLTVKAEKYVGEYSGTMYRVGKHELDDDATKDITLTWDGQKWTAEKDGVTFKVKCKLYTVTYTDGVKNKVIFKDELHKDLAYGSDTPKFTGGTPKRTGYTFTGWSPKVADTVTGNVTYEAQWKSNSGKDNVPKTGDGEIVMILGSVLLFSFCGATAVCLNDRKRKQG